MQGLPVEALRIDADAAARTLRRLGLKTIGSLINLPRASLARRFRGESIHENVLLRLDEIHGPAGRTTQCHQSRNLCHGASGLHGAGHYP